MDKITASVIALGILAVVFVSFFLIFRKTGKGKIKGIFGTGLEVEGSNEPRQNLFKEVEAGGSNHINETGRRGIDAYKLKAGGDITIGGTGFTSDCGRNLMGRTDKVQIITPDEIIDRIIDAPLYQQDDIRKYYIGLTVDWQAPLVSVNKIDEHNVNVFLDVSTKNSRRQILCLFRVLLSQYPELKVLHQKHNVRVVGKIIEVDSLSIVKLDEVTLSVLPDCSK